MEGSREEGSKEGEKDGKREGEKEERNEGIFLKLKGEASRKSEVSPIPTDVFGCL